MTASPNPREVLFKKNKSFWDHVETADLIMAIVALVSCAIIVISQLMSLWRGGHPPDRTYIPPPPKPAISFAVFVKPYPGLFEAGAVGFIGERLEIITIPPNQIRTADLPQLIDASKVAFQDTPFEPPIVGPESFVVVASKFERTGDHRGVSTLTRKVKGHTVVEQKLAPYFLQGDFDIVCGPLISDNTGYGAFLLRESSLSKATIHLSEGQPRGPPAPTRTVYVMGTINEFHGPDQFQNSFYRTHVLDLGTTKHDEDRYKRETETWNEDVNALETALHIPENELKQYSGEYVEVNKGKVIEVSDAEGFPLKRTNLQEWERDPNRPNRIRPPHVEEHPPIEIP